jgi:hypothetical protein
LRVAHADPADSTALVKIVAAEAPRQTGTDRIEAALNALLTDQRGGEKPR